MSKKREIIVNEKDVLHVLDGLNTHLTAIPKIRVGSCEWESESDAWFVRFKASNKRWVNLIGYLSNFGDFRIEVSEKNSIITRYVAL